MKKKRKVIRISKLESFINRIAFKTNLYHTPARWYSKTDGSYINHLHQNAGEIFKYLWLHDIRDKIQKTSSISQMADTGFNHQEKEWYIWRIDGSILTSPFKKSKLRGEHIPNE